jgi:hypothetical protein
MYARQASPEDVALSMKAINDGYTDLEAIDADDPERP